MRASTEVRMLSWPVFLTVIAGSSGVSPITFSGIRFYHQPTQEYSNLPMEKKSE